MDVLKNLENAVIDCLSVPNELLPESYRGKRSHRSLRSVVKDAQKRGVIETEHQKEKRLKAERIASYAKQYEENGSFEYDVNDEKLTRNQICFIELMGGLDNEDDI